MTLPWRGTTEDISAEADSRYETPGGAQGKVDASQEYLLHLLKLAVTGLSNGSEAAIARYSEPYGITYDWLKDRMDAAELRFKNYTINVKDFGAKGIGTDDTLAIKKAVIYLNQKGGGTLYFPSGLYLIKETIIFNQFTIVKGENSHTTTIKCDNGFISQYSSAVVFRSSNGANHVDAISMYDIAVNTNNQTVHAITGFSVYDSIVFQNVICDGLHPQYSAYRLIPHEGLVSIDPVSQTIIMNNCIGYVTSNAATAPVFYFDTVQEASLIGCKAFSSRSYPSTVTSNAPLYTFDGCRGINMFGCSVGGSPSDTYPIQILSTNRDSNGFYIAGTTFESCNRLLKVKGNAVNIVDNVNFVGSRSEGLGANEPTVSLEYMRNSNIEVLIGTASQTNVTTSIIRGYQKMQIIDDVFQLWAAGAQTFRNEYPFGTGTSVFLLVNNGTSVNLKQVQIGEADSAGPGYRTLRVSN